MCAAYAERYFQYKGQDVIRMLDFGCGCGRTTRFLQGVGRFQVHGTDVNGSLVKWCHDKLDRVTTTRNEPAPPLNAATAQYDFIFSLSIFTHLPEASMLAWLDELGRVTVDNGIVLLTTHGYPALDIICSSAQHQAMFQVTPAEALEMRETFKVKRFQYRRYSSDVVKAADAGGDYGNSFTHEDYIRERWLRNIFEIVEFVPGGLRGWQDVVILRRRSR